MIKHTRINFLSLLFCFISINAISQYNPETNSFSSANDPVKTIPVKQNTSPDFSQMGGFPCNANTFWATSTGVDEYTLIGNTVSFVSTACAPYFLSIAYCNNLNGGVFSPTFYDATDSTAAYYNGSNWTYIPQNGPGNLFNCGGNGNFLYYAVATPGSFVKSIARYDGVSFTILYTLPDTNQFISVADLNVDDAGNAWFFTGYPVMPYNTDTLNVVSPSGQLLKQYPFSYNTLNAYGSFMLNGIIYIGLGSANTFHPNTLIPVTITATTAIAGTPIPMPAGINYIDLAGCNAGTPLAVKENTVSGVFNLFPNPAEDVLTITSKDQEKNECKIFDVNGSLVQVISSFYKTTKADVHSLAAGIYFIELHNSKGISREKFVKL